MIEIIFTAFLLIFITWVLFAYNRTTERRARAVNMSIFSIKSVEGFIGESDLLNVFRGMHLKDWNRFLYGDPYISLEKVIQDGKTDYYVAIPKKYEEILSKDAHVSKVEGDVFPKKKHYAAVCLSRSEPRLKFGELKLHEDEGVVLQVLARHIHDGPVNFESNVRVMAWADSRDRAGKILNLKKIKNRKNRRLVFDFFSRVFENNKRVRISLNDLKNFLLNKFVY
ncbi:MAG: hypothetical protein HYS78_02295 [Parcubacteria group bacterium]|nr:hypothetical protein [Parcubacteria group bacterium]